MKASKPIESPKVGVGIIVTKEGDGKTYVMLHQRTGTLGKNYWGSGGGHLELGESLKSAALRELKEEAGNKLKVKNVRFLGVINFTELQPKHYVDVSFVAEWVKGEPINNASQKTIDWKWFPLDKLPEPLFPPVKTYLDFIKTGQKFHDSSFNAKA
ncbi:MAG: hypothetical protein HW400_497 [Candidatus Levybacteria bacterium]|nr:hypothetical protein [Candidatus Levybacteria bacterium]